MVIIEVITDFTGPKYDCLFLRFMSMLVHQIQNITYYLKQHHLNLHNFYNLIYYNFHLIFLVVLLCAK